MSIEEMLTGGMEDLVEGIPENTASVINDVLGKPSEKKIMINCGTALILKYAPEIFEDYSKGMVNCGTAVISTAMQKVLSRHNIRINCGNMETLDIKGEILKLGENTVIDGRTDYSDCFLYAEGIVTLKPEGIGSLETSEGMFVSGQFLYPESYQPSKIKSLSMQAYPDGFELIYGDFELKADSVYSLKKGTAYYITGELKLLEPEVISLLKDNALRFASDMLCISEGIEKELGHQIKRRRSFVVPSGYTVTDKLDLNASANIMFGKKVLVRGDLTIQSRNSRFLKDFDFIHVTKCAYVPIESAEDYKRVVKAASVTFYEGELYKINGKENFSHEFFETAKTAGLSYYVRCNGSLTFEKDVTAEDLNCINSLDYNGAVVISDRLKPLLLQKIGKGNGIISAHSKSGDAGSECAKKLESANTTTLNMGTYVLI